jgi:hypothetical protein
VNLFLEIALVAERPGSRREKWLGFSDQMATLAVLGPNITGGQNFGGIKTK